MYGRHCHSLGEGSLVMQLSTGVFTLTRGKLRPRFYFRHYGKNEHEFVNLMCKKYVLLNLSSANAKCVLCVVVSLFIITLL